MEASSAYCTSYSLYSLTTNLLRHGPLNSYSASPLSTSAQFPVPNHVPSPGPLPRPPQIVPAMHMPEPAPYGPSRAMQYALASPFGGASSSALLIPDSSVPALPGRSVSDDAAYAGSPISAPGQRLDTSRPARPRASSTPPTSPTAPNSSSKQKTDDSERTQCAGTTKKGERCTRQVRAAPPLNILDPEAPIERFCFQHQKEMMEPTGFYSRNGRKEWVSFAG